MSTQTNVLLMTPDSSVAAAVNTALQSNGHVVLGSPLRDLRDLAAQLGKTPTSIVLVDLDPSPQQMLPNLERMVGRFPASRFVALSTAFDNDLLLEAMQTGVRRVVAKQTLGTELSGVLNRLSATENALESSRGNAMTILAASGGCGATTLAVNIAQEIALRDKEPTLLIDLDSHYGALASYLGLSPRYAADHVLNFSDEIDGQLIRSTSTAHSDRLHLLASPASTNFAGIEPLKFNRLDQAMEAARHAYRNIVIDAPRVPMDVAATLASASNCSLLVFQLTVKDLRCARAMLDALRERGVDSASVIPIANRYVKRQMIGLEEARKALGDIEVLPIRNDYSAAISGLNYGQPLSEAGARSSIRRDLQDLLTRLSASKR